MIHSIENDNENLKKINEEINELNEQVYNLTKSLQKKERLRNDFDNVINNTESAYIKLFEGSQTLLEILKRDENKLMEKLNNNE